MKKALVILLILAVAGGLFAQDVKVGGQIRTGILFDAPNGTKGQTIGLFNDGDDGYTTRIDLNFSLTKEDYGVVVGLRNDWLNGPTGSNANAVSGSTTFLNYSEFSVYNAYVWADFANDLVNVKLGKIDDGVWKTEGDEEFGVATGDGLRVEVKPIPGLNAGIFLTVPAGGDAIVNGQTIAADKYYKYPFKYFLPETALGASYKADLFNVAFGVKFDSNGDGYAYDNPVDGSEFVSVDPDNNSGSLEFIGGDRDKSLTGGQRAYFGASIKAVENLKAVIEAQFYNLGAFNSVGYTWFDEVIEYAVASNITAGLVATQFFYATPLANTVGEGGDKAGIFLKFKPYGEYGVNDAVAVGVGVPFAFQKNVKKYSIGVEPYVTYKLADTASIGFVYKWNVSEVDADDSDPDFNQKVQINFNYSF
jgi:hypothetical protein